jgi:methylamine dehydrogenase heavy chain
MGYRFASLASLFLACAAPALTAHADQPPVLPAETSDVAVLSPPNPHRFLTFTWQGSAVIFDGDKGNIEGHVPLGQYASVTLSADNSRIYVGETMWQRGNRGPRIDLFSIYDGRTLNLLKEIELPGRALVGMKFNDVSLSPSGKRAYVYIMHPASSIIWVDLEKEAVGGSVEVPGCALVFAWGEDGVSSLCGDGSLATVSAPAAGPAKVTHTKPFFDVINDPIFDNSLYDAASSKAVFLSYTGLIYTATLGAQPVIDKPWSIQAAAGQKPASTGTDEVAWRPGGRQPIAWHKQSNRIFVLMHPGSHWSHYDAASEIWVLDVAKRQLLHRFPLRVKSPGPVRSIAVSQGADPQLYLVNAEGPSTVVNPDDGEAIRQIDSAMGEAIITTNF